jgi:hypothetical protein
MGGNIVPSAVERKEFKAALKGAIDELFKRRAQLDQINLEQFWPFFEAAELPRTCTLISKLVQERSFGHADVVTVSKTEVHGDTFKCRVFMRFVMKSNPGDTGRPSFSVFALGPRPGIMAN